MKEATKTLHDLLQEVQEDLTRRSAQEEKAQQQLADTRCAVRETEAALQAALCAGDQEAYRQAEEQLSFKKAVLAQMMPANAFWTNAEADHVAAQAYGLCNDEQKTLFVQAYDLMIQAEKLILEADGLVWLKRRIENIVVSHGAEICPRGCWPTLHLPHDFMRDLARRAGESYAPPSIWE